MTKPAFTPPELARRWRCTPETVLAKIHRGELRAFTLSSQTAKRRRWRITPDAIAEYEALHGAVPPDKPAQRKRSSKTPADVEYV